MAETTADVRRDIELTRERMSSTLAQLERKLNLGQIVKDNPWPAVGVAFGAGLLLSGTRSDVKAGAATLMATRGASNRIAPALDDIVSRLVHTVGDALQGHVDTLLEDVKQALGAPTDSAATGGAASASGMGAAHGGYGSTATNSAPAGGSSGATGYDPSSTSSLSSAGSQSLRAD